MKSHEKCKELDDKRKENEVKPRPKRHWAQIGKELINLKANRKIE